MATIKYRHIQYSGSPLRAYRRANRKHAIIVYRRAQALLALHNANANTIDALREVLATLPTSNAC